MRGSFQKIFKLFLIYYFDMAQWSCVDCGKSWSSDDQVHFCPFCKGKRVIAG
jgi:hypothetical protein